MEGAAITIAVIIAFAVTRVPMSFDFTYAVMPEKFSWIVFLKAAFGLYGNVDDDDFVSFENGRNPKAINNARIDISG